MSHLHLLLLRLSEFWKHCCLSVSLFQWLPPWVPGSRICWLRHFSTLPPDLHFKHGRHHFKHPQGPQGPQVPSTATAAPPPPPPPPPPRQRSPTHLLLCSTGPFAALRHTLTAHDFALCKCCQWLELFCLNKKEGLLVDLTWKFRGSKD